MEQIGILQTPNQKELMGWIMSLAIRTFRATSYITNPGNELMMYGQFIDIRLLLFSVNIL